jgi:hypothetical protein
MNRIEAGVWVRAEHAFVINVLETVDGMTAEAAPGSRAASLQAAAAWIGRRSLPESPAPRQAVHAEREVLLDIIDRALRLPAAADPLNRAWIGVTKRARSWTEAQL